MRNPIADIKSAFIKNLTDLVAASLPNQGFSSIHGSRGMAHRQNPSSQIQRFVHWAYVCVSRNSQTVAAQTLRLYATTQPGQLKPGLKYGTRIAHRALSARETATVKAHFPKVRSIQTAESIEEVLDHPFVDTMMRPNPAFDPYAMMELTMDYLDLTGDSYWWIEPNSDLLGGIPRFWWPLPSQLVTIVPEKKGARTQIKGYMFGHNMKDRIALKPEEIVHFKYPNPANPYFYGLSPLAAGAGAVDRYTLYDAYENDLAASNGMPDILVKYNGTLSDPQRRELELEWNQMVSMRTKNKRVKVADSDFGIEKLNFSPQEMSHLSGRDWTRQEICGIYNVPLALVTSEKINRATLDGAMRQYMKFGIWPRLRRIEDQINSNLIPLYNEPRLFVAYDNPVPDDQVLQIKQDESDLKNYIKSVNEIRAERGLEPVAWGQEPIAQLSVGPLSLEPLTPVDEAVKAIKALRTKAEDEEDIDRERTGGANPRLSKDERAMAGDADAFLKKQSVGAQKAGKKAAEFVETDAQNRALAKSIHRTWLRSFTKGANEGNGALPKGARLDVVEFVKSPETLKAVDQLNLKFADRVNKGTGNKLRKALAEGIEAGETTSQIADRIRGVYKGFEEAKRATMIARTETKRAHETGKLELWKDSGVVKGVEWDALGDACPFCKPLDGKIVSVGDTFKDTDGKPLVDGATYSVPFDGAESGEIHLSIGMGAVKSPPVHPSCRCTLIPIIKE